MQFFRHLEIFNGRYIWKYILAPWMGAALGIIAHALMHSSISVLGGNGAQQAPTVDTPQALSNFDAGSLAGDGAHDVFLWLDAQVIRLFKNSTAWMREKPRQVRKKNKDLLTQGASDWRRFLPDWHVDPAASTARNIDRLAPRVQKVPATHFKTLKQGRKQARSR